MNFRYHSLSFLDGLDGGVHNFPDQIDDVFLVRDLTLCCVFKSLGPFHSICILYPSIFSVSVHRFDHEPLLAVSYNRTAMVLDIPQPVIRQDMLQAGFILG